MKKYLIVALVILSSCQKEPSTQLLPINVKGKVLFTAGKYDSVQTGFQIYLANADGTNQKAIGNDWLGCVAPTLSNDGTKMGYLISDGNYFYLVTTDINGQNKTVLYRGKQFCSNPMWSPDDRKLCFVKYPIHPDTNYDIYTVNADGSNEMRLTTQHTNFSPQYLPDNSGIIYTYSNCDASCSTSGIYRMDPDGSNKKLLSPPGKPFRYPKVSPDGRKIAMNSIDWNGTQIFTMNTDGTNVKQMTFTVDQHHYDTGFPRAGNDSPVWSPNSDKLVYTSYESGGGNPAIFVINSSGSGNKRLTNNPLRDDHPCWTNDGNYIIYSSARKKTVGTHNYTVHNIYIMRSDGQLQTPITDNVATEYFPAFIAN